MPTRSSLLRILGAFAASALAVWAMGCAEDAAIIQLERQTLASLCTTDCPSAGEAADRGCQRARELGLASGSCSTTLRCAEGQTLVNVGRTAGADEAVEQWWFDGSGHLIASRHCRQDGVFDLCVHYGPDLTCSDAAPIATPG